MTFNSGGMLEQGSSEQLIMRLMPYHIADLRPEYEIAAEMRGETVAMADFLQYCMSLSQNKPCTEEIEARSPLGVLVRRQRASQVRQQNR